MERYAWKGSIVPGKEEEYIRRHDQIWPEMKWVLKDPVTGAQPMLKQVFWME